MIKEIKRLKERAGQGEGSPQSKLFLHLSQDSCTYKSFWRYHAIAVTELIVPFSKLFTKQYSRCFCVTDDKISEWVMESVAVFWMVTVGMK